MPRWGHAVGITTATAGIERYHYEPHEDAYNLIFEQGALHFGTQEFVVYNPRDCQVVTVHLQDLLQLTPEQLAFWFD